MCLFSLLNSNTKRKWSQIWKRLLVTGGWELLALVSSFAWKLDTRILHILLNNPVRVALRLLKSPAFPGARIAVLLLWTRQLQKQSRTQPFSLSHQLHISRIFADWSDMALSSFHFPSSSFESVPGTGKLFFHVRIERRCCEIQYILPGRL